MHVLHVLAYSMMLAISIIVGSNMYKKEGELEAYRRKIVELERELKLNRDSCLCDCASAEEWLRNQCEWDGSDLQECKSRGSLTASPSGLEDSVLARGDEQVLENNDKNPWAPLALDEPSGNPERDRLRKSHEVHKKTNPAYSIRCDVTDPLPPLPLVDPNAADAGGVLIFARYWVEKGEGEDTVVSFLSWKFPLGIPKDSTLRVKDDEDNVLLAAPNPPIEGHVSFGSSLTGVMPVVLEVSSKDELTIYGKKMIVMDIPNGEKLHRDDYQCWRKRHTSVTRENRNHVDCPFNPTQYDSWPRMPTLCEYTSLECRQANHFFGVPGYTIGFSTFGFSRADFTFIDFVLSARPALKHTTELGTGGGLVSLFLQVSSAIREGFTQTFDIRDCRGEGILRAWNHKHASFHNLDVFDGPDGMHPLVVQSVSRENNLVLFDGGSKMLEVARFGSKLAKTSLFLIHDWEDETFEAGFSGALEEIGFESVYEEFALHIGTHLRAYAPILPR